MNSIADEKERLLKRRQILLQELRTIGEELTELQRRCPHTNTGERRGVLPPWIKFCRDCGKEGLSL